MKNNTPNLLIALILLTIPLGYAAYVYPSLPNTIPTHFNLKGEADGFGGKDSIFLGPGIMAVVGLFTFFLLSNIKQFDPKKYKSEDDGMFKKLALLIVAFLSVLAFVITFSATNQTVNITKIILPVLGIFFAVMGWYMPKLHQNYFAGFKLPWTLENENNWNATHKVAGKWWLYGGIFQCITGMVLTNKLSFICFITSTLFMVLIPTVFSYRMFKNGNQLPS